MGIKNYPAYERMLCLILLDVIITGWETGIICWMEYYSKKSAESKKPMRTKGGLGEGLIFLLPNRIQV
jgi:hypothetical protein